MLQSVETAPLDDVFKKISNSDKERKNIELVDQFLKIWNSPQVSSDSIKNFCLDNAKFESAAFPYIKSVAEGANLMKKFVECLPDFHVSKYDVLFAKDNWVCSRIICEVTHSGKPFKNVQPSGKKSRFPINEIYEIDPLSGKIKILMREMDKVFAFKQVGWPVEETDF